MNKTTTNETIFTVESITDSDYQKLVLQITKCSEDSREIVGEDDGKHEVLITEHPDYSKDSKYSVVNFNHLYAYLKKLVFLQDKKIKDLEEEVRKFSSIAWGGFRQGKTRTVLSPRVKVGIEATAKFLKIDLIEFIAGFLEYCEAEPINARLYRHKKYQETIKSFLEEAPALVKQRASNSTGSSAKPKQALLSEQTARRNLHGITLTNNKDQWLDSSNHKALTLAGRKKEEIQLNQFAKPDDDNPFKIWAIAGPSGAGKTRLAIEWAVTSEATAGWDIFLLHSDDYEDPEQWAKLKSEKHTLIIIDYIYGYEQVIKNLIRLRHKDSDKVQIRLLLLDHVFANRLPSDPRWGFTDQHSINRNESFFYKKQALDLATPEKQRAAVKAIIAQRAGLEESSSQVTKADEYLFDLREQKAYYPLFAALLGDAIKEDKDFSAWSRLELMDYYLRGKYRFPWEDEDATEADNTTHRWSAYFIAVATMRSDVSYKKLEDSARRCPTAPKRFKKLKDICTKIITDANGEKLNPFKPDILGESFFLKSLQFMNEEHGHQAEFKQFILAENNGWQLRDSKEFVGFIKRLTRNLLNDDLNNKKIKPLWEALFRFMRPTEYADSKSIQWALTVGLIEIFDAIKDQFPENKQIKLLSNIDPAVLCEGINSDLLEESVFALMSYLEIVARLKRSEPPLTKTMFGLIDQFEAESANHDSVLNLAVRHGYCTTIKALIESGIDINASTESALLITACKNHQLGAVNLLLRSGIQIDTKGVSGETALISASGSGSYDIVRLLLSYDQKPNIEIKDNLQMNALTHASISGDTQVIKLLLDNGANIEAKDELDNTALLSTIIAETPQATKLLLDNGADIEARNKYQATALIWASMLGSTKMVKLLLDNDANIQAKDKCQATSLIWASINGHIEVLKLLLNHKPKPNIRAKDQNRHTALYCAKERGHQAIVDLLMQHGAKR